MDELAAPTGDDSADDAAATGGAPKGPVRAYCPAVLDERQPRLTSLVPVRSALVVIAILVGVTTVSLVETLHIYVRTTPLGAAAPHLSALDVANRGSLAHWFSAVTLALAAIGAGIVFSIRRHRVDDYRGRYRAWLWVAGALAWCSLDAATGLHESLGLAVSVLAGTPLDSPSLAAACLIGWLSLYGLLLSTLAIRVGIEIWPSLPAFSALSTATLLYFLGGMAALEVITADSPLVASTVASSLVLLAHIAVASTVLLYARHVHLDAQGRLKVHIDPSKRKKAKPKSRAKLKVVKEDRSESTDKAGDKPATKPAAAANTQPRFGQGSSGTQPAKAAATVTKPPVSSGYDDSDEDEDGEEGDDRMSKSERRRLKKMARREQGRRAA